MKVNRRELEEAAGRVVTVVLDDLGGSAWRDAHPEAYIALVNQAPELKRMVQHTLALEQLKRSQIG